MMDAGCSRQAGTKLDTKGELPTYYLAIYQLDNE